MKRELGQTPWKYLPVLDGWRALAVVSVLLFHRFDTVFPGGFIGVDIFFVLSGYLITSMLVNEYDRREHISLRDFWLRRLRRLVPAVVFLVFVCSTLMVALRTATAASLMDSVGALTWSTNWLRVFFGNELAVTTDDRSVLDHLWSLAVEEQFYVVWPLVVVGIARMTRANANTRRNVAVWALMLSGASVVMMYRLGSDSYFRTDARAFELLSGAAIGALGLSIPKRFTTAVSIAAFGSLCWFVLFVSTQSNALYVWGFPAFCVAMCIAILCAREPSSFVTYVLAHPVLRFIGQRSYGLYLWHIPVFRFMTSGRIPIPAIVLFVLQMAVLVVIVEFSYRYIEQPIRTQSWVPHRPTAVLSVVAVLVALGIQVPGARDSVDHQWDAFARYPLGENTIGMSNDVHHDADNDHRSQLPRALVVGDFLGALIGGGMVEQKSFVTWDAADVGCWFVSNTNVTHFDGERELTNDPRCPHIAKRIRHAIERFEPDVVVLSLGYWDTLRIDVNGRTAQPGSDELRDLYRTTIGDVVEAAHTDDVPVRVVLFESFDTLAPEQQRDPTDRALALAVFNNELRAVASRFKNVTVETQRDARNTEQTIDFGKTFDPFAPR